jgi:hypothetical protein
MVLAALLAAPLHAQDPVGAIEGVVSDPSGGAVQGARVVALNLERGERGCSCEQKPSTWPTMRTLVYLLPTSMRRLSVAS